MRIRDLRNAIVTTLRNDSRLAGVSVDSHGGRFDLEEIQQYAQRTPSVILTVMGAEAEQQGGAISAPCTFVLMLFCEDKPGYSRSDQVLDYSDAILRIALKIGQRWGLSNEGVGPATRISARNMFSRELDAKGIALWAVAWRQVVDLSDGTDLLVPLESIHVDWDLAPRANNAPLPPAAGSVIDASQDIDLT